MRSFKLQPSEDFTKRTIACIGECQRRKDLQHDAIVIVSALSPFIIRQIWLFVRHDYFSVERMPMAHYIVRAYSVFISVSAIYACGAFAVIFMAAYVMKNHRIIGFTRFS